MRDTAAAAAVSVVVLADVLPCTAVPPGGWPETAAAVLVVAVGAVTAPGSSRGARLAPVSGFQAAVLVLAQLCDDEGLVRAAARCCPAAAPGGRGGCWRWYWCSRQ